MLSCRTATYCNPKKPRWMPDSLACPSLGDRRGEDLDEAHLLFLCCVPVAFFVHVSQIQTLGKDVHCVPLAAVRAEAQQ